MKEPYGSAMFRKAAAGLGFHPYPQPSANLSQNDINPEGLELRICMFCGFCERYGCEHYAKASPQTVLLPVLLREKNLELRTQCQVQRIDLDSEKKRATGVTYIDASGREFEQPAQLVIVGMYALNKVRMLLLSGIGRPYDPATGEVMSHGRPIEFHPTPPGTPAWGAAWKQAVRRHYNHTSVLGVHGSSSASRQNYLDLDPTYKDAWGQPLLRMTFDFPENDLSRARASGATTPAPALRRTSPAVGGPVTQPSGQGAAQAGPLTGGDQGPGGGGAAQQPAR